MTFNFISDVFNLFSSYIILLIWFSSLTASFSSYIPFILYGLKPKQNSRCPNQDSSPGLCLKYLLPLCLAQMLSCLPQTIFPEDGE